MHCNVMQLWIGKCCELNLNGDALAALFLIWSGPHLSVPSQMKAGETSAYDFVMRSGRKLQFRCVL